MADGLTTSSRAFYEQTRSKMVVSLFLGSMACFALAYCSSTGGQSNSASFTVNRYSDLKLTDDYQESSQQALVSGYG
jgi:hypothetical protein